MERIKLNNEIEIEMFFFFNGHVSHLLNKIFLFALGNKRYVNNKIGSTKIAASNL